MSSHDTATLLSSVYSLRNQLVLSFAPSSSSTCSHPLSSVPPSQLPILRSQLTQTLSSLHKASQSFSSLLPSSSSPPPQLEKYLSLLSQSSTSQSTLLSLTSTPLTLFPQLTSPTRTYPTLHPSELKGIHQILPVLERVARDLGLVCFRDDEGSISEEETVTLSLGGKVMVVDFEVHRSEEGQKEVVKKVKVAYVFKGEQEFNDRAARKLQELFSNEGEGEEAEEEEKWSGVKEVLRELGELDKRTEREEKDWFEALDKLCEKTEKELVNSSPGDFPRILSNPSSLYPTLLNHSTPSARLNPEYTDTPSSSRALKELDEIPGTYTIKLELPPAVGLIEDKEGKEVEGWYRVHLERGVPISKKVGRRLLDALGIRFEAGEGRGEEKGEPMAEGERGGKTIGELLLAESNRPSSKDSQTRTNQEEEEDASYTISFERSDSSSSSNHHNSFRFKLATNPLTSVPRTEEESFVVTDLWVSSSETQEGEGMKRLREAIEVLREQIRINELVLSVVNPSSRDDSSEEDEKSQGGPRKRRKVTIEGDGLSLDELFGNNHSTPSTPLPVYIHLSSPSLRSLESPSILISFPTPHLPPHLASPLEVIITSTATGYQVRVLSKKLDSSLRAVIEGEKARMVLDRTGDLGVFLRWVCRVLSSTSSTPSAY